MSVSSYCLFTENKYVKIVKKMEVDSSEVEKSDLDADTEVCL